MKKILLTTIAVTALSNVAFAEEKSCCEEGKEQHHHKHSPIYLRVDFLGGQFHKFSIQGNNYKDKHDSYGLEGGLGYHVMDRIRAEIVYTHNFITDFKAQKAITNKATAKAVFLRGMVDMISFEKAKAFVGAGIGGSRNYIESNIFSNGAIVSSGTNINYDLAYSFHAGAAVHVVEGVMLEASWSMRNYGKTGNLKSRLDGSRVAGTKVKLRAQTIALGFRFDV